MARRDDFWFRPKRYGYGAGLPLCWQGWAMIGAHIALIVLVLPLLKHNFTAVLLYIVLLTGLAMPFYAAKTKGGWRWRWGEDR